jgi:hypothetical protein
MNDESFILLRMEIRVSGVKADLRKLFSILEGDSTRPEKLAKFEEFIDKNRKNTWWGFNNTKWRDNEDYEYEDGLIGHVDFVGGIKSHEFDKKYLIVKVGCEGCKPKYSPHFIPLIDFFAGNYGEYVELKIYSPELGDSNKVVFNFEDVVVSGETKSLYEYSDWNFRKEKLLTNVRYY